MDNKKDIAFWIMVFAVIVLCIYLLFYIRSESYECMSNPLIYGVQQYKTTQGEFMCTCSSPSTEPIRITKEGISPLQNYNKLLLPNG